MAVDYTMVNKTKEFSGKTPENGVMLTGELTHSLLGGFNKTTIQYGSESFAKAITYGGDSSGYGAEAQSGASAYRILNHGAVSFGGVGHMLR